MAVHVQCVHSRSARHAALLTCAYKPLYTALQEGGHFYIQMDFCEGGTLGQCAHKVGGAVLRQICSHQAFVPRARLRATLHASNQPRPPLAAGLRRRYLHAR